VYIQNRDSGPVSPKFVSALNSTNVITLVTVPAGDNFSRYLVSHSAPEGIVIPANFSSDFIAGKPVNVTLYGNPVSSSTGIVEGITASIVNSFNLGRPPAKQAVIGIQSLTVASSSYKYIDFLVPGLIGFAVLTSPMFALVNVSSTYKRDKIFRALSLTPLTKAEWLLSKIIWYILMTMISFVLMVATGIFAFGAHISLTPDVVPFIILGPLMFVSLGMLVGVASNSPESAAVVGNLVTFPMMFLSGTFFQVSAMPMYLQGVAHVLPLYYVIDGLTDVMIYGNYGAALYDLGVLVVIAVVFFTLAVRFFEWRED